MNTTFTRNMYSFLWRTVFVWIKHKDSMSIWWRSRAYESLSNKIYNRGAANCEILSLERNVIIPTSRNIQELRADLRSTYEIDGGFAPFQRQWVWKTFWLHGSYYRKRILREYVTFYHPGALRLMSLDRRHLRNHIRNTLLKRQFRAIHRLLR